MSSDSVYSDQYTLVGEVVVPGRSCCLVHCLVVAAVVAELHLFGWKLIAG